MKLYFRRQMTTSTRGMFSKTVEKDYRLYARLELDGDEQAVVNEFDLHNMHVYTRQYKDRDGDVLEEDFNLAQLTQGVQVTFKRIGELMSMQAQLRNECQDTKNFFNLAREVKDQPEVVVNLV